MCLDATKRQAVWGNGNMNVWGKDQGRFSGFWENSHLPQEYLGHASLITSKSESIEGIIERVMKKERKQFHPIDKRTTTLICSPVYRMLHQMEIYLPPL